MEVPLVGLSVGSIIKLDVTSKMNLCTLDNGQVSTGF